MSDTIQTAYINTKLVSRMLQGLAMDIEHNQELAAQIVAAFSQIGIFTDMSDELNNHTEYDAESGDRLNRLIALQAARTDATELYRIGGEESLRARLAQFDAATLRKIIKLQEMDPDKKTARLRSIKKLIDFIVAFAAEKIAREREAVRYANWLL